MMDMTAKVQRKRVRDRNFSRKNEFFSGSQNNKKQSSKYRAIKMINFLNKMCVS